MRKQPSSNPYARKAPVRQPQANPPRKPKAPSLPSIPEVPVKEKTPAMIIEEKMAAMAADPNAVPVYWTEKGPDAIGWDIIFPEFKVLNEAFRGGYGWYDLTEGRGRHLIPERKPYKIVRIPGEELKIIRAKEKAEQEAETTRLRAEKLEKDRRYRESLDEEKERKAMMAEEERVRAIQDAERRAEQKAKEDKETVHWAIARILSDIRSLPEERCTSDYLAEYIADRLSGLESHLQEPVIEAVATAVEKERRLFVTPHGSPGLAPVGPATAREEPAPLALPPPLPSATFMEKVAEEYNKIQAYIRSPWIIVNGETYVPAVDYFKGYLYIPQRLATPQVPQVTQTPVDEPCSCLQCVPPQPPLPPCDCLDCVIQRLPVVKARIVRQVSRLPPLLPTPSTPSPPVVLKKLRIPSEKKLQKFLSTVPKDRVKRPTAPTADWHNMPMRTKMIAGLTH